MKPEDVTDEMLEAHDKALAETPGGRLNNLRDRTRIRLAAAINASEGVLVPKAELLRIARLIEDLKRPCGDDPESPRAIQNARYQSIALLVRATIDAGPKWEEK